MRGKKRDPLRSIEEIPPGRNWRGTTNSKDYHKSLKKAWEKFYSRSMKNNRSHED